MINTEAISFALFEVNLGMKRASRFGYVLVTLRWLSVKRVYKNQLD